MSKPFKPIVPSALMEDDDFLKAYQVVKMKLSGKPVKEIAKEFNVSESTMYRWIEKWRRDGLVSRARSELLLPHIDDIADAEAEVLRKFPDILRRMTRIALEGRDQWAIAATEWLAEQVVNPLVEAADAQTVREITYIVKNKDGDFNPSEIPGVVEEGDFQESGSKKSPSEKRGASGELKDLAE